MQSLFILLLLLAGSNALAYSGSTFREVVDVIDDRSFVPRTDFEKEEYAVYQDGILPKYEMNMKSIFGLRKGQLERDSRRTVSERYDYYDRLEKLLHPNGVCVVGTWKIDKENPYSGYFKSGSEALFVGRVSVAMEKTTSKHDRGFGIAGKIFPTINPDERVPTTNFFTVDVLMGSGKNFLETAVTNEPEAGFKLKLLKFAMKLANALSTADKSPLFRPVSPIAKIGTDPAKVKSPKWIRLSTASGTKLNDEFDFRNEVLRGVAENGKLVLNIDVSETTKDRKDKNGWTNIGHIEIASAKLSYGCDRRLHFAHPKHND